MKHVFIFFVAETTVADISFTLNDKENEISKHKGYKPNVIKTLFFSS